MSLWLPLYDKTTEDPNWNNLYPNRGNINAWLSPNEPVFNGSKLVSGMSAECMRWAANSDKWILQMVNHYGLGNEVNNGSNCVAANWIDKSAFLVSHNPKQPLDPAQAGTIFRGNSTGDMWVDGGAENLGKWEDTIGAWHAVPGFIPTAIAGSPDKIRKYQADVSIAAAGSGIRLTLPAGGKFDVRMIDARGRIVTEQLIGKSTVLHDRSLAPGAFQVIAQPGEEMYRSSVSVAR